MVIDFTRCCVKNISYILTLFFIFILTSALLNNYFNLPLTATDSQQLPNNFPLLALWTNSTGSIGCRIISLEHLTQLQKEVGEVWFIPKNTTQNKACDFAFDYFETKHKWPLTIATDTINMHNSVYYRMSKNKVFITCHLNESENRKSRYSVVDGELKNTFFLQQKNHGFNLSTLPYSAMLTLCLWLFYKIYKRYQKIQLNNKQTQS